MGIWSKKKVSRKKVLEFPLTVASLVFRGRKKIIEVDSIYDNISSIALTSCPSNSVWKSEVGSYQERLLMEYRINSDS